MCPKQNSLRAWSSLFYAVVWTVWEARNICVFEEKEVSIVYASDLVNEVCVDRRKCTVCPKQVWFPHCVNSLKFNVDGSSRGKPGLAGIGCVLCNENGRVLCLFLAHVGIEDSNTTKIMAIHRALQLCVTKPALIGRDIVIIIDSKVAVSWINNMEVYGSLKHVELIYNIRGFSKFLGGVPVVYNPRHTNSFADSLAKMGSNMMEDRLEWGDI
ncbi:hypothetical protein Ddye_020031 [Dipteronia dyeriana]|uniref:RNase H type-1 domain-containing protein n=1 Tax=Dipteronia dyeriana TaxID=168575 RepID=A0AAD9WVM5_9ROSI|nr:hypothetical protein Ddye_020031 [Dipteronia dyeriana]